MTEKPNSIWAIEIFGGADLGVIPLHDEPVLALDDELWHYQKSDGSAAELCRQLENDDLVAKLIGPPVDISQHEPAVVPAPVPPVSTALADFVKSWTARAKKESAAKARAASDFGRWDSAKHDAAIRRIVNRARSADVFAPIRDTDF